MSLALEDLRESFEDFSTHITDHRITRNKLHSVEEILFLTLTAIICGAEGWRDIERFGKAKIDFLRQVFPFKNGIPSDDTIRRFFRALDPKVFQACFVSWVKTLVLPGDSHVAIDGKVSRHTFDGDQNPLHMVSAFASESRLVLAQEKVLDKSNEITAIPNLLNLLDLEGGVVTIDAMGCQREIAEIIGEKGADYVLSLKGNQGTLHTDVRLVFGDEDLLKELGLDTHHSIDGSEHGRLEERFYRAVPCPQVLKDHHNWPYLTSLVEVRSRREIKEEISQENRYYIASLEPGAEKIGKTIRAHWAIENSLHWVLDISFRDDDSRIRRGNAPENMTIIKHMALNMLQKAKGKRDSIKQMRKAAGWDNTQLLRILAHISSF
jgi:predicted transposase YbfD/YdcC